MFTQPIHTVPNLTLINNGTIEIAKEVYPVLELIIEPGADSDPVNLGFDWNVTAQTELNMEI